MNPGPCQTEDGSWSQSDVDWTDIETFKQEYIHANETFNPVKFRPDRWARLARECGFKYLLFTTKHHDGFCMFDTETTDYKITGRDCPFHTHPDADIAGSLYREFRREGLAISVYFSKPDWHHDGYWHKAFGTAPTRNVNYEIQKYPQLWEDFVQYTHRQLTELGTRYGKIDVLWLDGGWVRPDNLGQDIRLPEIIGKLRSTTQPHLIVCDRTVGGEFENIVTPEKTVPERPLSIPWETCTTIGEKFSFHYTDHFKSGKELVHLLLDVISKGGNLALNIAPQPDGMLPAPAVASMKCMGQWLSVHQEGIYETTAVSPYFHENIKYTAKKEARYGFFLYDEAHPALPASLTLLCPQPVAAVQLLSSGQPVPFTQEGQQVFLQTLDLIQEPQGIADCFKLIF